MMLRGKLVLKIFEFLKTKKAEVFVKYKAKILAFSQTNRKASSITTVYS